jgi:hypothetical protein
MNVFEPGMTLTGYVTDMPFSDYLQVPGVSKSALDRIERSPAHYKHAPPKEPTRKMVMGSAVHKAVLEMDRFADEYMIVPNALNRTCKAYRDAVADRDPDFTLTEIEGEYVWGMQQAVHAHPEAARLLRACDAFEVSGFVTDPETGLMLKSRPDGLNDAGLIIDLKKCQDARPDSFSRAIAAYGYHRQAALYSDQYEWITGKRPEFVFVCVEEEPPHAVAVYRLDDESIDIGRHEYRRQLSLLAECRRTDTWPAYSDDCEVIGLPGWKINEYENQLEVML